MKTALHSVSYSGTWGQQKLSLEKFILKASELGYEGVMLMCKRPHASILDLSDQRIKDLKKLMDQNNIELAALAGYTDFTIGLQKNDPMIVEIQIKYVETMARIASELGGVLVRIFTGYRIPDIPFKQQWDLCVNAIRECAQRCAKYNVELAVQNHHDIAVHYKSQADMLEEIAEPNCKAGFDAWSVVLGNEDINEAVESMAKWTNLTIAADYQRRPQQTYMPDIINYEKEHDLLKAVKIGEGIIDYKTFFGKLIKKGYKGWCVYEMCSPIKGGGSEENLDRYAMGFLEYCKDNFNNIC